MLFVFVCLCLKQLFVGGLSILFVFVRLCLQLFVGGLSILFVFVRLCLQLFVGGLSMLFVFVRLCLVVCRRVIYVICICSSVSRCL